MTSFDEVADEYDRGRPSYPDGVLDTLGPLDGLRVLEVGAGTGIATRQLLARGADVIAVDRGPVVLGVAAARSPGLRAVVADGVALPLPAGAFDLVCFAQSWHWMDAAACSAEVHRVLTNEGRWAAWWSHPRADGEAWFDRCWTLVEAACPGVDRSQRDHDWGATVNDELFDVTGPMVVSWTRSVDVDDWVTDQRSHSFMARLTEDERTGLLTALRTTAVERFPGGTMTIPYDTWLWIGRRRSG